SAAESGGSDVGATFARHRRMISSRFTLMNSESMTPPARKTQRRRAANEQSAILRHSAEASNDGCAGFGEAVTQPFSRDRRGQCSGKQEDMPHITTFVSNCAVNPDCHCRGYR